MEVLVRLPGRGPLACVAAAACQTAERDPICIDEFASVLARPAAARACTGLRDLMGRCGAGARA